MLKNERKGESSLRKPIFTVTKNQLDTCSNVSTRGVFVGTEYLQKQRVTTIANLSEHAPPQVRTLAKVRQNF